MQLFNALLVELHSKYPTNIIMEIAISSFVPIIRGRAKDLHRREIILESAVSSIPYFASIDKRNWYPAMERMKMNSSQSEIRFIEEIERMINLYSSQIQNISEEASMRSYLTESVQFYKFCRDWALKIKGDFKQNTALYAKLFDLIREQMKWLMGVLHPQYSSLLIHLLLNINILIFEWLHYSFYLSFVIISKQTQMDTISMSFVMEVKNMDCCRI